MVIIGVICIGIFITLAVYINFQSEETINDVGSIYMESMNERISKHFSTMVNLRLTQLDTLVEGIPEDVAADENELHDWLQYNAELRGFKSLAYFYEDGSFELLYGTEVGSTDPQNYLNSMRKGERKISIGIESDGVKAAVLGVPFELQMADGRKCISLIGKIPIEYISEVLSVDTTILF